MHNFLLQQLAIFIIVKNKNSVKKISKKNNAASEALITAGSAAIIKKYNAIGRPAKVPNPLTVPAMAPTKNFDKL